LDKVQAEVNNFIKDKIKYDFLKPDRELTLNLTVKEAELLISANPNVRTLAENGSLKSLHERCKAMQEKVDVDYLKVRDLIDRIIQQVEEKENEIYEQLEEAGVSKLKMNGTDSGLFDILGLSTGNASIGNFSLLEAFMEKNPDSNLKSQHQKLHSYLGVKYRALEAKAEIL
jgi:hypothetical protein